jgi:hypothetical protein
MSTSSTCLTSKQYVNNAFYPPPAAKKTMANASGTRKIPAPSTVTVDVYNGSGVDGLAGDVSRALAALGYRAGAVANASAQPQTLEPGTQVFYGDGASANAAKIAAKFGTTGAALASLPAGQVEVLLGSTVTAVPASLTSSSTPATGTQASGASAAPSPTTGANNGATGGAVTVKANAKYGIPCVY